MRDFHRVLRLGRAQIVPFTVRFDELDRSANADVAQVPLRSAQFELVRADSGTATVTIVAQSQATLNVAVALAVRQQRGRIVCVQQIVHAQVFAGARGRFAQEQRLAAAAVAADVVRARQQLDVGAVADVLIVVGGVDFLDVIVVLGPVRLAVHGIAAHRAARVVRT